MLTIFIQYTLVLVLRGRVVIFEPNIVIAFAEFCMVVGTTFFVIIETLERVTEWIRGDVKWKKEGSWKICGSTWRLTLREVWSDGYEDNTEKWVIKAWSLYVSTEISDGRNGLSMENNQRLFRGVVMSSISISNLRRWRQRGFYSEKRLVQKLHKLGYCAVRVPVSNPSLNPLPDVIGRKEMHVYAFEVKNASYYCYFPRVQVEKLFQYLDQFHPVPDQFKHAVIVAHLGKKWKFREIEWSDWRRNKLPECLRILKRDKGNFEPKKRLPS